MAGFPMSVSSATGVPQEVDYASARTIYAYIHAMKAKGFDIGAFYYSTRHGALLKYVPNYTLEEGRFLLTGQSLAAEELVQELANVGLLTVLKTAADWKQSGRLGQDWKITRQQVPDASDKPTRDEL
ncbi:hypothetical protein D3C76_842060 [compost metagenome]